MAITIDHTTFVISVLQSDLTFVSGTLYTMDTEAFRLALKTIEASEEGIVLKDTNIHNTEVIVAGIPYARSISFVSPYSIEFEDLQYTCILEGSNNNIWDVAGGILVQNQAQIIPTNSGGLVNPAGSNPTAIANAVWNKDISGYTVEGEAGYELQIARLQAALAAAVSA
jgi:hypothetical protein